MIPQRDQKQRVSQGTTAGVHEISMETNLKESSAQLRAVSLQESSLSGERWLQNFCHSLISYYILPSVRAERLNIGYFEY